MATEAYKANNDYIMLCVCVCVCVFVCVCVCVVLTAVMSEDWMNFSGPVLF